ncbi:MAG: redoxin domain-containing protein [Nocardioides sp.]
MSTSAKRPVTARRTTTLVALGLVAAFALSACGGADDTDVASESPSASAPVASPPASSEPSRVGGGVQGDQGGEPATQPDVVVPDVLDFEATTVSGDAFEGASVAGRPVVLWFWAPWCAVCRSQVPDVTDLAETYGEDVAFVGVGGLDSSDAIQSFADEVPGLTHLSDPDGELYQRFGISEQSSFVVLDAAGAESLRTGYSDDDALAGVVADLAG